MVDLGGAPCSLSKLHLLSVVLMSSIAFSGVSQVRQLDIVLCWVPGPILGPPSSHCYYFDHQYVIGRVVSGPFFDPAGRLASRLTFSCRFVLFSGFPDHSIGPSVARSMYCSTQGLKVGNFEAGIPRPRRSPLDLRSPGLDGLCR